MDTKNGTGAMNAAPGEAHTLELLRILRGIPNADRARAAAILLRIGGDQPTAKEIDTPLSIAHPAVVRQTLSALKSSGELT